jgi:hypothetical protein
MKWVAPLLLAVTAVVVAPLASAHSGGTNAEGCHTNPRTGDYHCHTPKQPAADRVTYCHVIHGERRCGYSRSTCDDLVSEGGGYCARD